MESFSSYIVYPFLVVQNIFTDRLKIWSEHRTSYNDLTKELLHRKQQYEDLQKELIQVRSFCNYFENTKDLRSFFERYNHPHAQITSILLKNFDQSHFFIIDKGSSAGIEKNMIAVYKDCLVGRIIEVYPLYSKVVLITDPLSKVASFCSTNGVKGIFEGTGQIKNAVLSYVNPLDEVKQGDIVLSSGEGLIFPRGFGVGKVVHSEKKGIHYSIKIELFLNFTTLDYCTIIPHYTQLIECEKKQGQH